MKGEEGNLWMWMRLRLGIFSAFIFRDKVSQAFEPGEGFEGDVLVVL